MRRCLVIVGATAVGKTELAYRLAKRLGLSIISADARQCYSELNIGVAKPSAQILAEVKHYFINSHSITDEVNMGVFQDYAYNLLDKELANEQSFLLVGGTGLYVQAFVDGVHMMPKISEEIRAEVRELYASGGLVALQRAIAEDKDFVAQGEMQNPERLMRALMIFRSSGKSIFWHHRHAQRHRKKGLQVRKIGIFTERETLYARINHRVDEMLATGLLSEVRALEGYTDLPALRTIGYRELRAFLRGECSLAKSVELIKQHTRNYAKRQETWFKRDKQIKWIRAEDKAKAIEYLCQQFEF